MHNIRVSYAAIVLGLLAAGGRSNSARAQIQTAASSASPGTSHNAAVGNDIVVSALREPVAIDKVSSTITVLDAHDIEMAQPVTLSDILETTPGISLVRNGGYGEATSLRIRGADPAQTIVVIDGMRMADATATDGGFDFSQLFTDDVSRVEILRGPQSILWGSDAIGGVVDITTVAPTQPLQGDFSVEAGSHQSLDAHAGLGGTSSLVDWRLAASEFTTDGIPSMVGGTQPNPYQRQAASGTLTFHLAPHVTLDVRGYWDNGRNSYSDNYTLGTGAIYAGDYALTKQWSLYTGLNVSSFDGRLNSRFAVLEDTTDSEDYTPVDTPALQFVGHGKIRHYQYQGDWKPANGVDLVFGAEREEQHMAVGSPYDLTSAFELTPHDISTNSIYGEARLSPFTGLTLNGGVRYDNNSEFGGHTVISAGGAYTPDSGITLLRASYDQGYKAPSLYQLYSDYGNAQLRPETSTGWEVAAERAFFGKAAHLSAAWFERNSANLIEFAYCPFSGPQPAACFVPGTTVQRFGYYANIDQATARGLELTGDIRAGHIYANANYSIIVSENATPGSPAFGLQLPRIPRHLFNAEIGYDWTRSLTSSVALRYSGASSDSTYSTFMLASYTLVDLRAEWKLPEQWLGSQAASGLTLFGRVENVGNRQYQTAYGYNDLGRVFWLGLKARF